MKTVKGELCSLALDGHYNMIVHGVNCQGKMAAGVAARIASVFPEAYTSYRAACKKLPPETLLGRIAWHGIHLHTVPNQIAKMLYVVNAFTQLDYRGDGVRVSYQAVAQAFKAVRDLIRGSEGHIKIAYPKIGAGLGGGDWNIIAPIIDAELEGCDHTLIEYDGT